MRHMRLDLKPVPTSPIRPIQPPAWHFMSIQEHSGSPVWKTGPQPRIKAVIARDTTYCVSLLTGPTGGSNFAIPSKKFHLTGMGLEFRE
jgi:hypothetical protein